MMNKQTSEIDWSQISSPLPITSFDRYIHQSIAPPIVSLGIEENIWLQCRSLALNLAKQGFIDPISILYTSFKRYYSSHITFHYFSRWLLSNESNKSEFPVNSISHPRWQSANELLNVIKTLPSATIIDRMDSSIPVEQIWFLISISIRLPAHGYALTPYIIVLDNSATRSSTNQKKTNVSRLHCLFAVTPSGRYSNQLYIYKPGRNFKVNPQSNSFARVAETINGEVSTEHVQQWLEDFLSQYATKNSALLMDPRTTLFTPEFQMSCQNSAIQLMTTNLNSYLTHVLSPFFSLFDKQWSEANRLDKMHFKSVGNIHRTIYATWFALRTLKQNDQIFQLFNKTILWTDHDQQYLRTLRTSSQSTAVKTRKKKQTLVKTDCTTHEERICQGSKTKLSSSLSMALIDLPVNTTPEEIFSYILHRQMSITRASKLLGGMKLDYFKYCLSYKMNLSLMTSARLFELNEFMQSKSTVEWLRQLRQLHFWSCAKQIFLREIYQLTEIISNNRSRNIYGNNHLGSLKRCDQQSPGMFWKAFEQMHRIQFDQEAVIDDRKWNDDFQQYLITKQLNHETTQLWTIDTFEFSLTKNGTILQLPEWNELRPMNLTAKVTVVYAFSNDGQSTEPHFIFPNSLCMDCSTTDEQDSHNELGHLTPSIFLSWLKNNLINKNVSPMVLIFCSRLPILSSSVFSFLKQQQIYPFGYPYTRTLPFRYLFERRVRNNRSTNLMSELWKRTLLDQRHTHVLKGVHCTVKNIKYYFQQIWPILIDEKRDDDEEPLKTFKEKCHQAFQQANIEMKPNSQEIQLAKKQTDTDQLVEELKLLLTVVHRMKEQIHSGQILKIKNEQASTPSYSNENRAVHEPIDSPSTLSDQIFTTNTIDGPMTDKRSSDENDEPRSCKRLRSCSQSVDASTTTLQWIPPSKQQLTRVHSHSSTRFQFLLSLVDTILTSSQNHLTDEQYRWLHSIVNLYDDNHGSNNLNVLIETVCKVVKTSLVR